MTFWTAPYRAEGVERDSTFYWREMDEDQGEASNDFFGQYVDFDAEAAASTATATGHPGNPPMSNMQESLLFDQHHDGTGSSGVSTADEIDFLSSSSQAGPTVSSVCHDIDPNSLAVKAEHQVANSHHYEVMEYTGDCAVSDTELPPLGDITLQSPQKEIPAPVFHQQSPSPPRTTTQRKTSRFVEALSSTIRKATTIRKSRKPLPVHQPRVGSPTLDQPPKALKPQAAGTGVAVGGMPVSPPEPGFIHGYCDDPFGEAHPPQQASPMRYYSQNGLNTPADTPALGMIKNEPMDMSTQMPPTSWPLHQMALASAPDQWAGNEFVPGHEAGWWDYHLLSQQASFEDPSKHTGVNMAMHAQQAGLPYEYAPLPDPSAGGLMIHMPQPQPPQPTVSEIAVSGPTYLPPSARQIPATERPHRAGPRAPSSGTRHRNMSSSPMRKTRGPRAPSASPTPVQSRHSSGGSISSVRSASGRLPATMPGTPCNVRKRRPREPSSSGGIEFVNFTSNDGKKIMTGVAPSGSSKTKARREKEAQEQSRRLSEAAMRLVEAAGGDVDKLAEHGFAF